MGLSIRSTDSNGTVTETPIGHIDLLKATYGLGDTINTRSVCVFVMSMIMASIALGAAIFDENVIGKLLLLTVAFQSYGYHIAGTARTRHMVKTLSQTSAKRYLPYIAVSISCYITGAAAAALCIYAGPLGVAGGIALVIANPIARYAGDIGFARRIWNAKRLERKSLNAMKKEGLGD